MVALKFPSGLEISTAFADASAATATITEQTKEGLNKGMNYAE